MNRRHTLARFLRLAVMACALLSCLTAPQTPALALSFYDGAVEIAVATPGLLPLGTSFAFVSSSTSNQSSTNGKQVTAQGTATVSPPGTTRAVVAGFAAGPGFANAASFASGTVQASIVNQNTATVTFPLTFFHFKNLGWSTIPFLDQNQIEFVSTSGSFSAFLDSNVVLSSFGSCPASIGIGTCHSFDRSSTSFMFGLTPGSHVLEFSANVSGFASSSPPPNPVPEPATLLLVGTTMAGIGLARWRQRRQKQEGS